MLNRGTDQSHELNCKQVNALLGAYLEGGLPAEQADAVEAHLDTCLDCRRAASLDAEVASRLQMEAAWQRRRLSPRAAARIQQRLYGRMRRSMMAQQVSRLAWGAVGMALLALVVFGGYAWWQQRPVGQETTPGVTGTPVLATQTANPRPTVGPTNTPILPTVTPAMERDAETIITFACSVWDESAYRDLADQFEAENPDIHVQLVPIDWAEADSVAEVVARADTLDTVVWPDLTRQGLFRDLSPFIAIDERVDVDDFYPNALESLQWDGGTWGLPAAVHFGVVYYDKELFDAAGVPYPEPAWIWEDLVNAAQALTRREGGRVVQWGLVWQGDPLPFMLGRVNTQLDGATGIPAAQLDRPEVAAALRWFADLALDLQVMPYLADDRSNTPDSEAARLIGDGTAAMWTSSSRSWVRWSVSGRSLGFAPYPVDEPTSASTPVEVDSYVMSAGTAHPDESWRWLVFLSRQSVKDGLPARPSVAEATGYWGRLEPDGAATYRFALAHGFSTRQAGLAGWSAIAPALDAVLSGRQSVESALSEAQQAADAPAGLDAPVRATATPFAVATPRPEPAAGQVQIEFAAHNWAALRKVYDELADEFHELNPEIHVHVKQPDYAQGYQAITLDWLADQGDCFSYFYPLRDEPAQVLLSLDPLLEADPAFATDDFYPSILAPFYQEGKLWALPSQAYPRLMYYNKDLFDAAGVVYPAPGWTLDDFAQVAARLSTGEGTARQYGYAPTPPWDDVWFFLGQQGVPLDGDASDVLADPNTAEAIRWYVGLRRAGITPEYELAEPSAYDDELFDRNYELWKALISKGKVAMWSGFPGEGDWWSVAPGDLNIASVEMPHGPGQVADLHLAGYYVSSHTEHPEACWEWFKFLSSQASTIQAIPARRSVARSDAYRQQMGEAADVYLAAVEGSQQVIDWAGFYWDSYRGRIVRAVGLALQGEDVEQALRQVQDQGEE